MPNWVDNTLTVINTTLNLTLENAESRSYDFKRFKESIASETEPLSFEKILPTPPELLDRHSSAPGALIKAPPPEEDDWYSWRCRNWGCKWDVTDVQMAESPGLIVYRFDTAWSPPTGIVEILAKRWPNLVFMLEYDEPGNDFWGKVIYREGQKITEEDGPSRMNMASLEIETSAQEEVELGDDD